MNGVRKALEPGRALVAYFTAGAPDEGAFLEAAEGAVRAGAALLEIGLPSPGPFADGPLLRQSHAEALRNGGTFGRTLDLAARLKAAVAAPLVLLAYPPDLPDGERAPSEAADAGFQGILIPAAGGAPPVRLAPWVRAGLSPAALLRPSEDPSPPGWASAFLYVPRHGGRTGEGRTPSPALLGFLDRLRLHSPLPRVAGFGVRNAAEVRALWKHAEGVAVGSALYRALSEERRGDTGNAVFRKVRSLLAPCDLAQEKKP